MPMTEDEYFAALFEKQQSLEKAQSAYELTLLELFRVVTGKTDPSRITVDLQNKTWARTALPESHVPTDPVHPV